MKIYYSDVTGSILDTVLILSVTPSKLARLLRLEIYRIDMITSEKAPR